MPTSPIGPGLAGAAPLDCESVTGGFLGQPANSVTSLAFVVAGIAILAGGRAGHPARALFGTLVAATGVGSFIQHGPGPAWADLAHDLPLVALIAYLAVDAAGDVAGRRLPARWWVAPTAVLAPVIVLSPPVADVTQALMAAVAVGLSLHRARVRPGLRATILTSLSLLAVGGAIGTLSRGGWPLCQPDVLLQGHAVWHVLAATALWRLAPAVGSVSRPMPARVRG